MSEGLRWTRRDWLTVNGTNAVALGTVLRTPSIHHSTSRRSHLDRAVSPWRPSGRDATSLIPETTDARIDPGTWEALAQRAVDEARTAGADYADARLTRDALQTFHLSRTLAESVAMAMSVRACVNGYWGFAAASIIDPEAILQLARAAVAQARTNARGPARTITLAEAPAVRGRWETPVGIDPFQVPIEEKLDTLEYYIQMAINMGRPFSDLATGATVMNRHERVLATSQGTCCTQTLFESSGSLEWTSALGIGHLDRRARGWEIFRDANIRDQIRAYPDTLRAFQATQADPKPVQIGQATIVCDGAAMAQMLEQTLGVVTQLDRALGYEANAGGTSFVTDPLAMAGNLMVASPLVSVTANRSAPTQLGTVRWDDEGVVPQSFPLVKNGVLVDFQTTREQATWLAPYYQKEGIPVRSRGCAGSESALMTPMQHMPNLALEPAQGTVSLEDLAGTVTRGILVRGGSVATDMQARSGLLSGSMFEIKNGRIGRPFTSGGVLFNTMEFWKNVTALGGASTTGLHSVSQDMKWSLFGDGAANLWKGQPKQVTSHTASGVAAVIPNQKIIDPTRRA